jgi:hypothetical protein
VQGRFDPGLGGELRGVFFRIWVHRRERSRVAIYAEVWDF